MQKESLCLSDSEDVIDIKSESPVSSPEPSEESDWDGKSETDVEEEEDDYDENFQVPIDSCLDMTMRIMDIIEQFPLKRKCVRALSKREVQQQIVYTIQDLYRLE